MTDLATAYRGVRVRVRGLVVEYGAEADSVVPATPEWTVHDVVADLGGITADIVSGNLAGAGTTTCGDSPPTATLRITRFEFTRAVTGRRSPEQIAAYEWDGEARPDLLVVTPFTPRLAALVE